jgi:hypothetical protein
MKPILVNPASATLKGPQVSGWIVTTIPLDETAGGAPGYSGLLSQCGYEVLLGSGTGLDPGLGDGYHRAVCVNLGSCNDLASLVGIDPAK